MNERRENGAAFAGQRDFSKKNAEKMNKGAVRGHVSIKFPGKDNVRVVNADRGLTIAVVRE